MIGRTLDDRYTMIRLLGQGGMGAVYEARHAGTGRRVAVKVILGQAADDELVRRFQREARAVGAVESEHIAQVFDTGRDRETGAPYIAMEFLEGEDVQALIERLGPLPVDLALRIGLQASLGLERAHEAGIVHRDIKPANLFLARKQGGQRVIKVLDFGVAKVTDNSLGNGGMTKSGALLGSPLYMSPEQARGSGAIDARSDVWSLGISLYHALSGHRPNEHLTGLGELVLAICTTPVRWIQEIAPWVPPEVAHVVHRALVIDPAGRTGSAGELAAALRAFLPGGEAIVEAMLVPLDAATRASRASFGAISAPPHASSAPFGAALTPPRTSSPSFGAALTPPHASNPPFGAALTPPRASAAPFDAALTPPRASAAPFDAAGRPPGGQSGPYALSATAPATSVRLSNRPERPASRPPVALIAGGVLAAALAGGAGVYLAVRSVPPATPAPSAEPAPPAHTEAEPPPPSAGVEARPTPTPTPSASAEPPPADTPVDPPAAASSTPAALPSAAATARAAASASVVARPPAPRPSAARPPPTRPPRNDDDETSRK
ncbi:protein kinase domain-containing protein [Sorangium sp. So ce124]|uniref:protein kinase domain-containing protein n=1 Tax=Sorangium sp. So ce124 TaxID=3133280 RepID=UPI003F6270FB